jgi:acyl carrier protein
MKETDADVENHLGYNMELRQEIKKLMADSLNLSVEQLGDEVDIRTLEKDSIDVFEMICELEDHYNITISNEDFKAFVIVKAAIDEIERLVKSK